MAHQVRIVDVFTEKALAGNQLAVVLDGRGISDELMQRIAREMNFSETTFILPPDDPTHAARVRIFTPVIEMPFAGHPTVGTAWVMANEGMVREPEFTLELRVGPVRVRGASENGRLQFWMTHPEVRFGDVLDRAKVARAIGLTEADLLPDIPTQVVSTGNPFVFAALRDARAVDAAISETGRLQTVLKNDFTFGIFLFAPLGENRFYSRMFSLDIPEDPATGSGSGPLGAFAVRYGLAKRGPKVSLVSEQGTKMGRQSFIHIALAYNGSADIPSRIEVGGSVMPVLKGELL